MLLLLACLIVLVSALVQTTIGFGLALIAVPLLVLIDPQMVPAPLIIVSLLQLSISAWKHRSEIHWKPLWIALITRIPGTALAVWLMGRYGIDGIKIFIATSVLLAVAISLFKFEAEPNQRNHAIAGFFSALSGTTTAIGGPPMALLYQNQPADYVRANLSAYFTIGSMISLAGVAMGGFITAQSWVYVAWFVPATLLGTVLGLRLRHRVNAQLIRPAILVLCSASALIVIGQTLVS
ncbi:sulfite exporter TauE/SafE family protein [Motiliproteus coralliicola]|uniref:Probable membrane transporter protein n=1 Tax=Motiliproteus coralliicola TaxID=2283196 RepID=A0A369WCJ3_9GAMM|nr:sulfite exporter TauE/SafE family protein [Motiliproteus coralliicola]RDE19750.1 sulfite exporter TauE/SafE family protein [Motiliproteus coralliicola]